MTLDSLGLAVEHQGILAIGIGFVAGLLFSFNPVAIASVPVALAYVTKSRDRSQAVRFGLVFVLGMIAMHVALGFLSGLIGRGLEEVIGRPWGVVLGPILIAFGAISLGMGSRAIAKAAAERPQFVAAVTHAVGGSLIPVPGGVLIRDAGGKIIGAVGISGENSDNDEAAALAGVAATTWKADPGA